MASKLDITLKRYNGTTVDELFPTTTVNQIISQGTAQGGGDESLSSYLDNTFINVDQLGVAEGVATLDENSKLLEDQLPTYLFGGLKFRGNISLEDDDKTIDDFMAADPENPGTRTLYEVGQYLQIATTGNLGEGTVWEATIDSQTFPVTITAGDWLIVNEIDYDASPKPTVTFALVTNTFSYATTEQRGIVRLTDAINALNFNKPNNLGGLKTNSVSVITEGFMATNVSGGQLNDENNNGAPLDDNLIARTDHLHDGRYFTEEEIEKFFDGTTAIGGYNNDNWDTAYDDKINSASFGTSDGVLTLTQQDAGTITVDLDGRYAETIAAAQTDSTDGIVVSQTGDDYTIAHFDTSSVSDIAGTDGNVLQEMTFDTYGHVQTRTTVNLDDRYYTETEINDWLTGAESLGPDNDFYTPIEYGENLSSTVTGAILIETD